MIFVYFFFFVSQLSNCKGFGTLFSSGQCSTTHVQRTTILLSKQVYFIDNKNRFLRLVLMYLSEFVLPNLIKYKGLISISTFTKVIFDLLRLKYEV